MSLQLSSAHIAHVVPGCKLVIEVVPSVSVLRQSWELQMHSKNSEKVPGVSCHPIAMLVICRKHTAVDSRSNW